MLKLVLFCLFLLSSTSHGKNQKQKLDLKSLEKDLFKIGNLNDLTKLGYNVSIGSLNKGKLTGRNSGFISLQADIKEATPGKCDPKPVCIANPLTTNISASNQIVFPPCINIHRCDGCCPQNEKCVAIKTETVKLKNVGIINITLTDIIYEDNIITVQNHTDCECRCQWEKNEDCQEINANFVKAEDSCSCVCPKVLKCDGLHEFDRNLCKCVCNKKNYARLEDTCKSRNMKWNEDHCRCEAPRPSVRIEITKS